MCVSRSAACPAALVAVGLLMAGCAPRSQDAVPDQAQSTDVLTPNRGVATTAQRARAAETPPLPPKATLLEDLPVRQPEKVTFRDGGATTLVGGKILWFFGDTFLSSPLPKSGNSYRTNTAALAPRSDPRATSEPTDNGLPRQAIRFSPGELPDTKKNRIALWPGSLVRDVDGSALAFINRRRVVEGDIYGQYRGIRTARFPAGSTEAKKPDARLLFSANEPEFSNAALLDGWVYLYGKLKNPKDPKLNYGVARARHALARQRDKYRFWDGRNWVADVGATAGILGDIPGEMTVSKNRYLQRYFAVHSLPFDKRNRVVFRTARSPQGPWSGPIELFTGQQPPEGQHNYAGREHPELSPADGRLIYVSYARPLEGFLRGELRLVKLEFQQGREHPPER
jgi:uncharacterized protein DUF4185